MIADSTSAYDPLAGPPPQEVPLPKAPLVRVIAQVRFPTILAIRNADAVSSFQEAIRQRYPILQSEHVRQLDFGQASEPEIKADVVWRFSDVAGSWRASLASSFLALETTTYESRNDFLERLDEILRALEEHIAPTFVSRIGLRYIDRLTGPAVDNIARLVRPEVLGIATTPLGKRAEHLLSEALFQATGQGKLRARWGDLPSDRTIDPGALEPVGERSWILDFDMFLEETQDFATDRIIAMVRHFAEHIYAVFRWTVTDDFLRHYGGEP